MWLASHTERIEFGTLVSPVSFREPVMLARQALMIDELSGGRLQFGVGAGWQEREHTSFGYDLLDTRQRLDRFAEALEVMTRLLRSDEPTSWQGQFYQLHDALLLPRPTHRTKPPIVIGGNGPQRTLPLTARFADEWNAVFVGAAKFAELNARLDALVQEQGRDVGSVRRSLMTNIRFGRDDAEVQRRLRGQDRAEMRERGIVVGTANDVVEQLGEYAQAGVQRIMLQWLDLDDTDGIEALSTVVLGQV
jgi:alkanesulfonate monooxygenase SsuD/methylene tetrahydromethanopterin reductase-like flavin-dependent oxidoreductase (luciferase family)